MRRQSVMIMKTPGGVQTGYVRMTIDEQETVLTFNKTDTQDAHIVAFLPDKEGMEIYPDSAGNVRVARMPQAIVYLEKSGRIRARGGNAQGDAALEMISLKAQNLMRLSRAKTLQSAPQQNAGAQRAKGQIEEHPKDAKACTQEEKGANAVNERTQAACGTGRNEEETAIVFHSAWPPPPFFPAAQFTDEGWRG